MIVANGLQKKFGKFTAVESVDLDIKKGEVFGLLGPNGAGKSTIINMLYGTVQRTQGELKVLGFDPKTKNREIKKRLGVVTQDNALDESLTVEENMLIYCAFVGVERGKRKAQVAELLDYMNLGHKRSAKIQALSGGMKRRLVFVRALLGNPELLILDEPTTGLDPAVRQLLWGKVKELHKSGTTILLTTHYMHEAEVLCDRLVILNQGKIVAEGSPQKMIHEQTPGYVGIFPRENGDQIRNFAAREKSNVFYEDNSGACVRSSKLESLTAIHAEGGIVPLQIRPANLEDVFLKLTGQELSSDA